MTNSRTPGPVRHRSQRGVVLLMAMIVLVAMSIAAVVLMRGVMTSNRVAANLAFQQAAAQSAEVGMETAIAWLEQKARELQTVGSTTLANKLNNSFKAGTETYSYSAIREDPDQGTNETWQHFWDNTLTAGGWINSLGTDTTGNTISFVIHRLCSGQGASTDGIGCEATPTVSTSTSTSSKSNTLKLTTTSQIYYRITVRVQGQRNAVSFIQAVVAI